MITVNVVFFFLLIYYLLKDFNKTVLCYLPLKLMTSGQLIFCSWKGGTGLQFDIFANAAIVFLYITRKYGYGIYQKTPPCPLTIPIYLVLLSICLSNVYGSFHALMTIIDILQYLYIFVFWAVLCEGPRHIRKMISCFYFIATLLCIDYLFEAITGFSPIREYMRLSAGSMAVFSENVVSRQGMLRIMSFAPHAAMFGCYCAILFLSLFYYKTGVGYKRFNKIPFYVCMVLLLLGVVLSNSRSPIIFVAIASLTFISFSKENRKQLKFILFIILIGIVVFHSYFEFIYMSLFHQDQVDVEGSTTELRELQLATVYNMVQGKELFGLGPGSVVAEIGVIKDLAGAESVWFPMLGDRGYFGVITYLIFFIWTMFLAYHNFHGKFIFLFTFGYFCLSIVTSLPSLNDSIFVPIILTYYYLGLNKQTINTNSRKYVKCNCSSL